MSLHKLGWVHRDISSGNILLFEKQVKIADFEYAKQMDLPGKICHDIRTVTWLSDSNLGDGLTITITGY